MKTYTIKPEYFDLWDEEANENTVLTENDVEQFAEDWEMSVAELKNQLDEHEEEETDMNNKIWYAVQRNTEDDWGTGSYSLTEAIQMAKKQLPDYPETLVAVIENDTCIDEIRNFSDD